MTQERIEKAKANGWTDDDLRAIARGKVERLRRFILDAEEYLQRQQRRVEDLRAELAELQARNRAEGIGE